MVRNTVHHVDTRVETTPRITPEGVVAEPGRVVDLSPARQAFWILRVAFTIAPIIAGVDKFFNGLTNWGGYLAPWALNIVGGPYPYMYVVGVIEIIAGIGVAIWPRVFSYIVAVWLACIIINLLTFPGFFDIALRDFGLLLGAVALARLAQLHAAVREPQRA